MEQERNSVDTGLESSEDDCGMDRCVDGAMRKV